MSDEKMWGHCEDCGGWIRGRYVRDIGTGSGGGASIVAGHVRCPGPARKGDPTRAPSWPVHLTDPR